MNSKIESPAPEKLQLSRRQKAKRAAAALTAAAAFGGLATPIAHAEGPHAKGKMEMAFKRLRNPGELPGIKIHLGANRLKQLKLSTLELGYRFKSQSKEAPWNFMPNCTAVKVTLPGQKEPEIMTANHCLFAASGVSRGLFTDAQNPQNKAENFINQSQVEYAVFDPQDSNVDERFALPIATVDGISMSTDNKDTALLHAVGIDPANIISSNIRSFEKVPSIPLKVADKPPIQGTPVALYGEPQANNFEPIADIGIYLGRVWDWDYGSLDSNGKPVLRQLDLVGVNPQAPQQDNCNYGTSGSMALLPNGELLGNLTLRTNRGYGENRTVQLPDNPEYDQYIRPIWERMLNVKLDSFATICGYTVMDKNTPAQLQAGLELPASIPVGKG